MGLILEVSVGEVTTATTAPEDLADSIREGGSSGEVKKLPLPPPLATPQDARADDEEEDDEDEDEEEEEADGATGCGAGDGGAGKEDGGRSGC